MSSWLRTRWQRYAALAVGVVIGATLITPASAHVGSTFSHLWTTHIKPAAKEIFYTKSQLRGAGSINSTGNPVHWSKLRGVPADLADGSDDGWEVVGAGSVNANGTTAGGYYDWSAVWSTDKYLITFPDLTYTFARFSTQVTPACPTARSAIATAESGKLKVQILDAGGNPIQCNFQFSSFFDVF